jgi:uncharacterized protein YsxB (DUF464 family)|tara:strand:+ start:335 stop:604 length:270 start_codon:yes stop_codon:yes gene_type:complete
MTNTITFEQAVAKVGTKQDALDYLKEIYVDGEFEDGQFEDDEGMTFEDFLVSMDDMCEDYSEFVHVVWHVATGKTNKWVEWVKEDGVED